MELVLVFHQPARVMQPLAAAQEQTESDRTRQCRGVDSPKQDAW